MPVPVSSPLRFVSKLALCARLKQTADWLPACQFGASVASPGSRIIDMCAVAPGLRFDNHARITDCATPAAVIKSDVGAGGVVFWHDGFDCRPGRARRITDRAVEVDFFESGRHRSRKYVRRATRYPDDWFVRPAGIKSKPGLGSPGDLLRQLHLDMSLAVFDEVILMTKSYVTGAHLNHIPEEVGVWRFDPDTDDRKVVREPHPLSPDSIGVELVEYYSLRTDVALVSPAEGRTARLRLTERAYGEGWRVYDLSGCARARVGADGCPIYDHFNHVVDPDSECNSDCPAFEAADPPELDHDGLRESQTDWVIGSPGAVRRQSGLNRYR